MFTGLISWNLLPSGEKKVAALRWNTYGNQLELHLQAFFHLTASERPEEVCLGGVLRRHGDIHHVHSNSSVIVICCVSVPLPLETGFMFTWEALFSAGDLQRSSCVTLTELN